MADEFNKYYKDYNKKPDAYRMDKVKETSRVSLIKEMLEKTLKPGARVLDVGCGDMHFSLIMPQFEWEGVDIAPHHAPKAVAHDLMEPPYPFEKESFDAVVCSEVLEHLFDLRVVHREVNRLTKMGGTYIISTPNVNHMDHFFSQFQDLIFDPMRTHHMEHIRFYDHAIHKDLLQQSGFKVNEICGADAHYSRTMQDARASLVKQGIAKDLFAADVVLGKCFPYTSHTVILRSNKVVRLLTAS